VKKDLEGKKMFSFCFFIFTNVRFFLVLYSPSSFFSSSSLLLLFNMEGKKTSMSTKRMNEIATQRLLPNASLLTF